MISASASSHDPGRRCFLGADVGGTKTQALVVEETGRVLGLGRAGGGNPEGVGFAGLAAALQAAAGEALEQAGLAPTCLSGAGFGVAGYDWPSDRPQVLAAIETLGLSCPVEAANDAVIGLLAGAEAGWGVAVVAGTSNNCRGRDRFGREGRVTGEGARFGEYGGAAELAVRAVQAVSHAWIRRGPPTQLSQALLDLTGASDVPALLEGIARGWFAPRAAWAITILRIAETGDPAAREIAAWAGRELGELVCAVIRQLEIQDEAFEVIQVGSLWEAGPLLSEPLRQTVQAFAPGARPVRLAGPPVVGGVLLGMQAAGQDGGHLRRKLLGDLRATTALEPEE